MDQNQSTSSSVSSGSTSDGKVLSSKYFDLPCSAFLIDYLQKNPPPLKLKTLTLATSKTGKSCILKYENDEDPDAKKVHSFLYHDCPVDQTCWIIDRHLENKHEKTEALKAIDVFQKDLDVIWSHLVPGALKTLKIELSNFDDRHLLEHIRRNLSSASKIYKIRKLKISAFLEKQVMQILPFLDQYHLKSIHFFKPHDVRYRGFFYKFEMAEIEATWQFFNCERVQMEEMFAHARLRMFLRLQYARIRLVEVRGDDVVALKEACSKPLNPQWKGKEFEVTFENFENYEKTFLDLFGPPTLHDNGTKSWRKEISMKTDILKVVMKPNWFSFYRPNF